MFPVAMNMEVDSAAGAVGPDEGQCAWVLDFTLGGRMPGIVMSQARMREIEAVVNPFSTIRNLQGGGGMLSFTNGSWVDMLVRSFVHPQDLPSTFIRSFVTYARFT